MNRDLFEGQNDGEKVVDVYRRHFSLVLVYVTVPVFLLILTLLAFSNDLNVYILYFFAFSFVVSLFVLLSKFLPWWFTYYILTNQRLKFVNQKSLFRKSVMDVKLSDIEHISYGSTNIWQELVKIPTLRLQIIGGDLEIKGVARSTDLYNRLQNLLIDKGIDEN